MLCYISALAAAWCVPDPGTQARRWNKHTHCKSEGTYSTWDQRVCKGHPIPLLRQLKQSLRLLRHALLSSRHLIRRFDTEAISASSLFRVAFPTASEEAELVSSSHPLMKQAAFIHSLSNWHSSTLPYRPKSRCATYCMPGATRWHTSLSDITHAEQETKMKLEMASLLVYGEFASTSTRWDMRSRALAAYPARQGG